MKVSRSFDINFGNESRSMEIPNAVKFGYWIFLLTSLSGLYLSRRLWRDLIPIYLIAVVSLFTTLVYYGSTRQSAILILPYILFASVALDRIIATVVRYFRVLYSNHARNKLGSDRQPIEN